MLYIVLLLSQLALPADWRLHRAKTAFMDYKENYLICYKEITIHESTRPCDTNYYCTCVHKESSNGSFSLCYEDISSSFTPLNDFVEMNTCINDLRHIVWLCERE